MRAYRLQLIKRESVVVSADQLLSKVNSMPVQTDKTSSQFLDTAGAVPLCRAERGSVLGDTDKVSRQLGRSRTSFLLRNPLVDVLERVSLWCLWMLLTRENKWGSQGFLRMQLNCLELPMERTLIHATNNTAKDRPCIGLTKIKGIRSISCIYWRVQFHTPNLSLLISNLDWYSWLIRMAWSSSNSPPAPCLFQLRSLRLPGTAAVGTQSMGKCETDQKRDTLAVSTGWQLGLTIGNNVVIYS